MTEFSYWETLSTPISTTINDLEALNTSKLCTLRATGCVKMTSMDHLRSYCKCFLSMIIIPYYVPNLWERRARTLRSSNPSQNEVNFPSGFRNMKHTLQGQSQFRHRVATISRTIFTAQLVRKLLSNPLIMQRFLIR